MTTAIAFLKAGNPAHWILCLAALWVAMSFMLSKFPKVKANTTAELIFNLINPKVLPILQVIPIVGPLLAAILKSLDTPVMGAPKMELPELKPEAPLPPAAILLLLSAGVLSACGHMPPSPPSPAVQQYRAQFAACMAAKGIKAGETAGDDILKILENGSYTADQMTQQIEGLGIAIAGGGIQDLAICAVTSWFAQNPVVGGKATPSQAAARLYLLKHLPPGPGVHSSAFPTSNEVANPEGLDGWAWFSREFALPVVFISQTAHLIAAFDHGHEVCAIDSAKHLTVSNPVGCFMALAVALSTVKP